MLPNTSERRNVYDLVTEQITAMLTKEIVPWRQPWGVVDASGRPIPPTNAVSKRAYRGVNVWLLACAAQANAYSSPYWLSYKQAESVGGHVRKGERSTTVVFWKFDHGTKTVEDDGGEIKEVDTTRVTLRYYAVFNAEQTEGCKLPALSTSADRPHAPIDTADEIIAEMPKRPTIRHGGDRAYYAPKEDYVQLPYLKDFETSEAYYAVAFHELGHSTGHSSRVGRGLDASDRLAPFGSADYSREELVAEFTAAYLCAFSGIENLQVNSAAYIKHWTNALANDHRMVVIAAAQGQKAADYILGIAKPSESEGAN